MLVIHPNGAWQTLNFIICGFFTFLLGIQTLRLRSKIVIKQIVGIIIALSGIIFIALAFFPTDQSIIPTTFHGSIHMLLFVMVLIAFLISVLLAGLKTIVTNKYYASYSIISFGVSLVSCILMIIFQNYLGVFQRVIVTTSVIWFIISPLVISKSRVR
jgi:hypothetical protein